MKSAAFTRAERTRRRSRPVSAPQRRTLARLARLADMEEPIVRWSHEASDAIARLLKHLREPTLGLRWAVTDDA